MRGISLLLITQNGKEKCKNGRKIWLEILRLEKMILNNVENNIISDIEVMKEILRVLRKKSVER